MRIYKNCEEALNEIKRDLAELGVCNRTKTMQDKNIENDDDYVTNELQGYSFCIVDDSDKDKMVGDLLNWNLAEFVERTSDKHINPGKAWKLRKIIWNEFKHTGRFGYTYNERIRPQLNKTIELLNFDSGTRQAIITIYNQQKDTDNRGGKVRIPCSMHYQFMKRNDALDVIYVMRSCDLFTHFKNDIWQACKLRDYIAEKTNNKPGKFFMFIGSLHGYKKDMKGVF